MSARQKRIRTAVFLLAAIILVGIAYSFWSNRGPRYQGKSITYWFREYYLGETYWDRAHDEAEVTTALRSMGTNALPYLVGQAFNDDTDSNFRRKWHDFLEELPGTWPRFVSREAIRRNAAFVIRTEIHPPAELILPMLQNEITNTNNERRDQALSILGSVTNGADLLVPCFVRFLHDPDTMIQTRAANALASQGPRAAQAVPELLQLLTKNYWTNEPQRSCVWALGAIGSNATAALPTLTDYFHSETNEALRLMLAATICRIDPHQSEPMNYLLDGLQDRATDKRVVPYAAFMLANLGPDNQTAMSAVVEAIGRNTNAYHWPDMFRALKRMNPPVDLYLPVLKQKLAAPDESSRFFAAENILAAEPANREAQAVMVAAIENHSTNEPMAIIALVKSGPVATSTVPVILKSFEGTNRFAWSSVSVALERIAPPREPTLSQLKAKLSTSDSRLRVEIAIAIVSLDPADPEARKILLDQLREVGDLRVIKALAKVQPPAQEAIPLLRGILKSRNQVYIKEAAAALRKIEAATRQKK